MFSLPFESVEEGQTVIYAEGPVFARAVVVSSENMTGENGERWRAFKVRIDEPCDFIKEGTEVPLGVNLDHPGYSCFQFYRAPDDA